MAKEPSVAREEFGFQRTVCGCEFCKVYCRHLPGALDPSDLDRICPKGQDLLAWSEEHLRALLDKPYPTLVPARRETGYCHWYFDGKCAVHDRAPYCCAFFDSHMSEAEVARRTAVTVKAIEKDAGDKGRYYQVWLHLRRKGLIAQPGDRVGLLREMRRLRGRGR